MGAMCRLSLVMYSKMGKKSDCDNTNIISRFKAAFRFANSGQNHLIALEYRTSSHQQSKGICIYSIYNDLLSGLL